MHPGAGARIKCWSPEKFGELCKMLRSIGAKVVLIGGKGENDIVDRILAIEPHCDLVTRELPLREIAAIVHCAAFHVGNDSGLTHLAGAVETATVAIFGPSASKTWGPTNPTSIVVYPTKANDIRSRDLRKLGVKQVFVACAKVASRVIKEIPKSPLTTMEGLYKEIDDDIIYTASAAIEIKNCESRELLTKLLAISAQKKSYKQLCEDIGPTVVDFAIATGLILPSWAFNEDISQWLRNHGENRIV